MTSRLSGCLSAHVSYSAPPASVLCTCLQGDALHGDWVGIVELSVDGAFLFDIYLNFRWAERGPPGSKWVQILCRRDAEAQARRSCGCPRLPC